MNGLNPTASSVRVLCPEPAAPDTSQLIVLAETADRAATGEAGSAILAQIDRLKQEAVPAQELARHIALFRRRHAEALGHTPSLVRLCLTGWVLAGDPAATTCPPFRPAPGPISIR